MLFTDWWVREPCVHNCTELHLSAVIMLSWEDGTEKSTENSLWTRYWNSCICENWRCWWWVSIAGRDNNNTHTHARTHAHTDIKTWTVGTRSRTCWAEWRKLERKMQTRPRVLVGSWESGHRQSACFVFVRVRDCGLHGKENRKLLKVFK